MNIAIDGPGGSGKSVLAKNLARGIGLTYVDTGALYRTVGLAVMRRGIEKTDTAGIISSLSEIRVEMKHEGGAQKVLLSGEDVTDKIRTPEVSMYASAVSAVPEVRAFLKELQLDMVRVGGVVMDGRDIGTVIMPDADVKIFLFANPKDRAERRYEELAAKGMNVTLDEVLSDMNERDNNDATRAEAPAVPAADAVMLDNSGFLEVDTYAAAVRIINEKTGESFDERL
ncbi:MAG: (d)CMP kinase [Clostridiales bacterium]|nr:(d)CMP kinase [Clostridiales bacterium]